MNYWSMPRRFVYDLPRTHGGIKYQGIYWSMWSQESTSVLKVAFRYVSGRQYRHHILADCQER